MEFINSNGWRTPMGTMRLQNLESQLRSRSQELALNEPQQEVYRIELKDPKIRPLLVNYLRILAHRMISGGMKEVIFALQSNPKYKDVLDDLPTWLQIAYKLDAEDPRFRAKANDIARRNLLKLTLDGDELLSFDSNDQGGMDHE